MMRNSILLAAASALLLGLLASPTLAAPGSGMAAVGSGGEIYRLQVGTYGQYFSAGLIPAANSVLVLEVRRPDRPYPTRLLVPGTETEDLELAPSLMFEETSGSVVVVWSSQWNYIHSRINLALFTDGLWSEVIELSGDVWSRKSFPAVAVTRDTSSVPGEDGASAAMHQRTIYNVVWWEEAGEGDRVAYSPVVFVDGDYIGWNPVFLLTDLPSLEAEPLSALSTALLEAPSIQAGSAPAVAVTAFVHPPSGRLVTMELSTVAGELVYLADQVTADLVAFAEANTSATVQSLGERARAQMVDIGQRIGLHPGVLGYLTTQVQDAFQQANAASGAVPLVERARAQMVDIGARMTAQGLSGQTDISPAWLMEFSGNETASQGVEGQLHLIRLRQVSAYPAPTVEASSPSMLFSESGKHVVIAWQAEQEMRYVETLEGGTWSERRSLQLGPQLTAEQALELLAARVRNR